MKELNVFSYGYLPFGFKNCFSNIHQFFRNIKYAWQRATKGYCDQDLWAMDYFYSQLFVESMKDFTKGLHGAPERFFDKENDSIQPWIDYINEMATHFYNSIEINEVQKNEYPFESSLSFCKDGNITRHELTDEQRKSNEKWFEREREIATWREEEMRKGFDMMKEVFFGLWD